MHLVITTGKGVHSQAINFFIVSETFFSRHDEAECQ